jgi:serine/threonine protein kinase
MAKTENAFPSWPGWETVRLIGRGSFGAVYEIRRDVFGNLERCALKYLSIPQSDSEIRDLRSEGLDEESITRSFQDQAKDIVNEYMLMARLNDFRNVVSCHDVDCVQKDSGYGWDIFIRMELLTPLMDLLSKRETWPEAEVVRLGRDIAAALCACDRLHILHRDVKPQNIFVAADGSYKLGDFGIARIAERTGSATARIGTFTYMAPEVYHGEHYGAAADQYSLGIVLYWLLNGRRAPFVGVNTAREKEAALRRRMSGEPLPAPASGSEALKKIVLRACAYDPAERYRSAEELLRDLDALPVGAGSLPARGQETDPKTPGGAAPSPKAEDASPRRPAAPAPEDATVGVFTRTPASAAPAGASPGRPPYAAVPAPADEDRTRSDLRRSSSAPKPGKGKKTALLLAGLAAVAALALAILLWPKGEARPAPAEAPTEAPAPAADPTPEPVDETALAYENALTLLEAGQYEEAVAAFEALGDYEDSAARLTEARYGRADALAASGETYAAARAFYEIKDYRDSRDRCFALWGQIRGRNPISAGGHHTAGLRSDASVVAVGFNENGQCEVGSWRDIALVSAGLYHTVGLRSDGTVLAVGNNESGQCEVSGWENVIAVSAGEWHTVGLRADGTVLAAGYNGDGQCEVSGWTDMVAVSAGLRHTVGLRSDGTVVATTVTGDQKYNHGQCEVSDWTDIMVVSAGFYHTVGLRADGTVLAVGEQGDGRCEVSGWTDVVDVSAGYYHTVGLRADGTVVAAGKNDDGQCDVSGWTDVVAVSARNGHTVALLADGTLVATGANVYGQCEVSGWRDIKMPK